MNIKTRRLINSSLNFLITFLGNTVGIWLSFLIIFFFKGIINNFAWPGLSSFVYNGSLLIISFSFFTTVITSTLYLKHLNVYNTISIIGLALSTIIYAKYIGLGGEKSVDTDKSTILLYLPFFIALVLLFFTLKNRKKIFIKSSWLDGSDASKIEFNVFLSFAIAGNKSRQKREETEEKISRIESKLIELGYPNIFNAANYFTTEHDYQPPEIAAIEDFNAIENSRNLLFFYPEKAASSALVELGYALREGLNITIFTKNKSSLPFLTRELSQVNRNVRLVVYRDFDNLISILEDNHSSYFIK